MCWGVKRLTGAGSPFTARCAILADPTSHFPGRDALVSRYTQEEEGGGTPMSPPSPNSVWWGSEAWHGVEVADIRHYKYIQLFMAGLASSLGVGGDL